MLLAIPTLAALWHTLQRPFVSGAQQAGRIATAGGRDVSSSRGSKIPRNFFNFVDPEEEERERKRREEEERQRKAAEDAAKRSELIRKFAPVGGLVAVGAFFASGVKDKDEPAPAATLDVAKKQVETRKLSFEESRQQKEARENDKRATAAQKIERDIQKAREDGRKKKQAEEASDAKRKEEAKKQADEAIAQKKRAGEEKDRRDEEMKRRAREEKAKRDAEDTREFPLVPSLLLGGAAYLYTRPKGNKAEEPADKKEEKGRTTAESEALPATESGEAPSAEKQEKQTPQVEKTKDDVAAEEGAEAPSSVSAGPAASSGSTGTQKKE